MTSFIKFEERKKLLLYLIYKERLFTIEEAVVKLEYSIRTVKRTIKVLKEQGYQIKWNQTMRKFILKTIFFFCVSAYLSQTE